MTSALRTREQPDGEAISWIDGSTPQLPTLAGSWGVVTPGRVPVGKLPLGGNASICFAPSCGKYPSRPSLGKTPPCFRRGNLRASGVLAPHLVERILTPLAEPWPREGTKPPLTPFTLNSRAIAGVLRRWGPWLRRHVGGAVQRNNPNSPLP